MTKLRTVTLTSQTIELNKTLDGAILFFIGREVCKLPPPDAIALAQELLRMCGIRTDVGPQIIKPGVDSA